MCNDRNPLLFHGVPGTDFFGLDHLASLWTEFQSRPHKASEIIYKKYGSYYVEL